MLLPSALSCDARKYHTRSYLLPGRSFSPTPPPSDDVFPAGNGLFGTCRTLQSLLNASPAPTPRRSRPERLLSPLQMRPLPARRPQKVVKPARGANKRDRSLYEEGSNLNMMKEDLDNIFSTPKRRKRAPSDLPLGLVLSDFESLESDGKKPSSNTSNLSPISHANSSDSTHLTILPSIENPDPALDRHSEWTAEDDQKLIEIVLEKLQLSKRDWEECARQIGKDNDSVGRRWKALVGEGNIGLRRGRRFVRGCIDESWR